MSLSKMLAAVRAVFMGEYVFVLFLLHLLIEGSMLICILVPHSSQSV